MSIFKGKPKYETSAKYTDTLHENYFCTENTETMTQRNKKVAGSEIVIFCVICLMLIFAVVEMKEPLKTYGSYGREFIEEKLAEKYDDVFIVQKIRPGGIAFRSEKYPDYKFYIDIFGDLVEGELWEIDLGNTESCVNDYNEVVIENEIKNKLTEATSEVYDETQIFLGDIELNQDIFCSVQDFIETKLPDLKVNIVVSAPFEDAETHLEGVLKGLEKNDLFIKEIKISYKEQLNENTWVYSTVTCALNEDFSIKECEIKKNPELQ